MKLKYEMALVSIVGAMAFIGNWRYGKRLDDVEKELGEARLENSHLKIEIDILRDESHSLALYNRAKIGSIPTFADEHWGTWAEGYVDYFDNKRYFEH